MSTIRRQPIYGGAPNQHMRATHAECTTPDRRGRQGRGQPPNSPTEPPFLRVALYISPQTNASFYLATEKEWDEWAKSRGSLRDIFESAISDKPFDVSNVIMENLHDCVDLLPSHLDLLPVDLDLAAKWGAQSSEAKMIIKDRLEQ